MINFKDLNISNIYNGQTEVSAVYLGSTKIYSQSTQNGEDVNGNVVYVNDRITVSIKYIHDEIKYFTSLRFPNYTYTLVLLDENNIIQNIFSAPSYPWGLIHCGRYDQNNNSEAVDYLYDYVDTFVVYPAWEIDEIQNIPDDMRLVLLRGRITSSNYGDKIDTNDYIMEFSTSVLKNIQIPEKSQDVINISTDLVCGIVGVNDFGYGNFSYILKNEYLNAGDIAATDDMWQVIDNDVYVQDVQMKRALFTVDMSGSSSVTASTPYLEICLADTPLSSQTNQ